MASPLVLIAEDNAINQLVARAMLRKEGLGSVIAHDGGEAVELALSADYAAIFMDCQMPELDGYEATRRIRAREQHERVPIIAMTAHSLPSDRDRCLAAGMDDYISKPVGREQLREVISRWLADASERCAPAPRRPVARRDQPGDPSRQTPVLDEATVARLRSEHPAELRRRLLEVFELALPTAVQEILDAAERGDQDELKRTAHRLRGSSLMLGSSRLSAACQSIEGSAHLRILPVEGTPLGHLRAIAQEASAALRQQLL